MTIKYNYVNSILMSTHTYYFVLLAIYCVLVQDSTVLAQDSTSCTCTSTWYSTRYCTMQKRTSCALPGTPYCTVQYLHKIVLFLYLYKYLVQYQVLYNAEADEFRPCCSTSFALAVVLSDRK